jgi:hypothetical protein
MTVIAAIVWNFIYESAKVVFKSTPPNRGTNSDPSLFVTKDSNPQRQHINSLFNESLLSDDKVYTIIEFIVESGKFLSAEECLALYEFLKKPCLKVAPHRLAGIKNAVLHILRGQTNLPKPWDEMLADLFLDRKQIVTMRDYALQHLFTWYEELRTSNTSTLVEKPFLRMEAIFWQGTGEIDSEIGGTALLGLHYLSQQIENIDRERIQKSALDLTANQQASILSRATALQICGQLGLIEALPVAIQLTRGTSPIPLQCSAIAALGELGGAAELDLLETLLKKTESGSLNAAIIRSIKQLTAKK